MMNAALALGAELGYGTITALVWREDGSTVRGVEIEAAMTKADAVVIALGPWCLGYEAFWPISDLSPYQLDPVIQLVVAEMVGACLECHASRSLL